DARDRDVVDVELLLADEGEQEVERSRERGQLDDEQRVGILGPAAGSGAVRVRGEGGAHRSHCPVDGRKNRSTAVSIIVPSAIAGRIQLLRIPGAMYNTRMSTMMPYRDTCMYRN